MGDFGFVSLIFAARETFFLAALHDKSQNNFLITVLIFKKQKTFSLVLCLLHYLKASLIFFLTFKIYNMFLFFLRFKGGFFEPFKFRYVSPLPPLLCWCYLNVQV